jgi:predicted ATPase
MFITEEYIRQSVANLEFIHPFYGTTFLVCKQNNLPVGESVKVQIGRLETEFLEKYYLPNKNSEYFYRIFRVSDKAKHWVHYKKYATSTLQSTRTQSTFAAAFLHERRTDLWGWQSYYVDVLLDNLNENASLYKSNPIPIFYLAVWLYRDRDWASETLPADIIDTFLEEFLITQEEALLFDPAVPVTLYSSDFLQNEPITELELSEIIGTPPDQKSEEGATLAQLRLYGVGPVKEINFEPLPRLNFITGDNGLGKSFLLECVWWALTNQWTELYSKAVPAREQIESEPEILFKVANEKGISQEALVTFDHQTQRWRGTGTSRPTISGLVLYAKVNGSFAIWDSAQQPFLSVARSEIERSYTPALVVDDNQAWNGAGRRMEGMLRDWIKWQNSPDPAVFNIFKNVLAKLSPQDLGLIPGKPRRLPLEAREIPTLEYPYGEVLIVHASAAVRRIVTLAYLIVWAWNEHLVASEIARTNTQARMVILIDELEAHLHPLWQRTVLSSLLEIGMELKEDLQTQFIIATHSPLVMASAETVFDDEIDKLFHLDLRDDNTVEFREQNFIRYGSVDSWLTSPIFDLRHARSLEADKAIEDAKLIQQQANPEPEQIEKISERLLNSLSADDVFWPRWVYFAEKNGIDL